MRRTALDALGDPGIFRNPARTVAPEENHHVQSIGVAPAQKLSVGSQGSLALPAQDHVPAFGGRAFPRHSSDQRDISFGRSPDDEINVLPVRLVGPREVVLYERLLAEPAIFAPAGPRDQHRLNDGDPSSAAIVKVVQHVAVRDLEHQMPTRVGVIEEGLAFLIFQIGLVDPRHDVADHLDAQRPRRTPDHAAGVYGGFPCDGVSDEQQNADGDQTRRWKTTSDTLLFTHSISP